MSGAKTVHYIHFMNWVRQLPGTDIRDYDRSQMKGVVQTCLEAWETMFNVQTMQSTSSDLTYGSLWKEKLFFSNLRNPTQTVLCMKFKDKFLKYLFGDLKHEFKDMDKSPISYNAAEIKGAFTFDNTIALMRHIHC